MNIEQVANTSAAAHPYPVSDKADGLCTTPLAGEQEADWLPQQVPDAVVWPRIFPGL